MPPSTRSPWPGETRSSIRAASARKPALAAQFATVFDAVKRLIAEDEGRKARPNRQIGFLA